ncbi:MAG: autotransporter outer membrane beta-barrel domain-containing protein, partial [Pseudomonadota bacterium]
MRDLSRGRPAAEEVTPIGANLRRAAEGQDDWRLWVDTGAGANVFDFRDGDGIDHAAARYHVRLGVDGTLGTTGTQLWAYLGHGGFRAGTTDSGPSSTVNATSQFVGLGARQDIAWDVYLQGEVQYGWDSYDVQRGIAFGAINRTALSDYGGTHFAATLRLGWEGIEAGGFLLSPHAGVNFYQTSTGAFAETGAGSLNLALPAQSYHTLEAEFGLTAHRAFDFGDGIGFDLDIAATGYAALDEDYAYASSFADVPGSDFITPNRRDNETFGELRLRLSHRFEEADARLFLELQGTASVNGDNMSAGVSAVYEISF